MEPFLVWVGRVKPSPVLSPQMEGHIADFRMSRPLQGAISDGSLISKRDQMLVVKFPDFIGYFCDPFGVFCAVFGSRLVCKLPGKNSLIIVVPSPSLRVDLRHEMLYKVQV